MNASMGLIILISGIVFFLTFTLVNFFMDGVLKIVLFLLPILIIIAGITLICSNNKNPNF